MPFVPFEATFLFYYSSISFHRHRFDAFFEKSPSLFTQDNNIMWVFQKEKSAIFDFLKNVVIALFVQQRELAAQIRKAFEHLS